jgi:DNA segregation ATPase FtsK/SpoIIIE, S-DNA-T family
MGKGKTENQGASADRWVMAKYLLWFVFVGVLAFIFWDKLLAALGLGVIPALMAILGLTMLVWFHRLSVLVERWNLWLGAAILIVALLGILAFFAPADFQTLEEVTLGGYLGQAIIGGRDIDNDWHTALGVLRVIGVILVGGVLIAPHFAWSEGQKGVKSIGPVLRQAAAGSKKLVQGVGRRYSEHPLHEKGVSWVKERVSRGEDHQEEAPKRAKPVTRESKASKVVPANVSVDSPEQWQLPGVDLLDETVQVKLSELEVEKRARLIEEALASYGVDAKVVQTNMGPTVTQFGVEPGWDRKFRNVKDKDRYGNVRVRTEEVSKTRVKVERITSLQNDLALALAVPAVRMEAPVPGKAVVGIEVPNTSSGVVSVREVLESPTFKRLNAKTKLALALGKGTGGEMAVADLAKMPHVLVAGATGSGKTVCLDTIIVSLLVHNTPDDLRFIMIDPKRVELIAFDGIPHLMNPVITESEKAVEILKWLVHEMDNRYKKLAQARAHNIDAFNRNSRSAKPMPYIVLVVDELADLMMMESDEVEPLLCRLAQMGRAVGIHSVVATQRPSVDVITGLIKANFPTRISFAVASQVDSRTILDTVGAEKLLGRGDMLYLTAELAKPKRLQGCFTSQPEIDRVTRFWSSQAKSQTLETLVYTGEEGSEDPLLGQARRLAAEHKQISASYLQRQLRIGLARAEQLVKQLEEEKSKSVEVVGADFREETKN